MAKWKRWISAVLVLAMTLGLAACGKGETAKEEESRSSSLAKKYVYRMEAYDLKGALGEDGDFSIRRVLNREGRIYVVAQDYADEQNALTVLSMNPDGSDRKAVKPDAWKEGTSPHGGDPEAGDENVWFNHFDADKDGAFYAVKEYNFYPNTEGEEDVQSETEQYVCAWNPDGTMRWETKLESLQTRDSYSYVNGITAVGDGSAVVLINGDRQGRILVDSQGNAQPLQPMEGSEIEDLNTVLSVGDGKFQLVCYENDFQDMCLIPYDAKENRIGEKIALPKAVRGGDMTTAFMDSAGNLVYTTTEGVFRYTPGDAESKQIMSFVNSDLNITDFQAMAPVDEDHFVAFFYDDDSASFQSNVAGGLFTRIAPEDLPDKKEIVLAGLFINWQLRRRIVQYNRSNPEYRIVLREYGADGYDGTDTSQTQMNQDILSGNAPDIMVWENPSRLREYARKGIFADIGKLMQEDAGLSGLSYLDNVFEACKIDGTLYEVVPSFYVNTYVGKKSLLGDRSAWSMDDAKELLASMPEGTKLFGNIIREGFFQELMSTCGKDIVDPESGTCHFDSPQFLAVMEFAKTLPEDYDNSDDEDYSYYETQYRENRTLLMSYYLSNFMSYNSTMNGQFGEEISFVGFPGLGEQGSTLQTETTYTLAESSANKEEAWNFIRYYLTEEYQKTLEYQFPVLRDQFDANALRATGKPYYEDENGNKVEYDETYWLNGEEITLPQLTESQIEGLKKFITGVDKRVYNNNDILNIINEEMDAFYTGQKSAADVAGLIQNRVKLYLDENS